MNEWLKIQINEWMNEWMDNGANKSWYYVMIKVNIGTERLRASDLERGREGEKEGQERERDRYKPLKKRNEHRKEQANQRIDEWMTKQMN